MCTILILIILFLLFFLEEKPTMEKLKAKFRKKNKSTQFSQDCGDLGINIMLDLDKLPVDHNLEMEWDFFIPRSKNENMKLDDNSIPRIRQLKKSDPEYVFETTEHLPDKANKICLTLDPTRTKEKSGHASGSCTAVDSPELCSKIFQQRIGQKKNLESLRTNREYLLTDRCRMIINKLSEAYGPKDQNKVKSKLQRIKAKFKRKVPLETLETRRILVNIADCCEEEDDGEIDFVLHWMNNDLRCENVDMPGSTWSDDSSSSDESDDDAKFHSCTDCSCCTDDDKSTFYTTSNNRPMVMTQSISPLGTQHYTISYNDEYFPGDRKPKKSGSRLLAPFRKLRSSLSRTNMAKKSRSAGSMGRSSKKKQRSRSNSSQSLSNEASNVHRNVSYDEVTAQPSYSSTDNLEQSYSGSQGWLPPDATSAEESRSEETNLYTSTSSSTQPKKKKRFPNISRKKSKALKPAIKKNQDNDTSNESSSKSSQPVERKSVKFSPQLTPAHSRSSMSLGSDSGDDSVGSNYSFRPSDASYAPLSKKSSQTRSEWLLQPIPSKLPFDVETNALISRLQHSHLWSNKLKCLILMHAQNVQIIRNISKHIDYIKRSGDEDLKLYVRNHGVTEEMIHQMVNQVLAKGDNVENAFQRVVEHHMGQLQKVQRRNDFHASPRAMASETQISSRYRRVPPHSGGSVHGGNCGCH